MGLLWYHSGPIWAMLGPIAGYTPRFPSCQVTCHCQRWSLVAPKAGRLLPLRLVTCCPEGSSHVGPKAGHLLGVRLVTCCPFGWAPVAPEASHLFPLSLVTCQGQEGQGQEGQGEEGQGETGQGAVWILGLWGSVRIDCVWGSVWIFGLSEPDGFGSPDQAAGGQYQVTAPTSHRLLPK